MVGESWITLNEICDHWNYCIFFSLTVPDISLTLSGQHNSKWFSFNLTIKKNHLCLTGPLQNQYVFALYWSFYSQVYTFWHWCSVGKLQRRKLLLILNVLKIIYCVLKLSSELLKPSVEMKSIFKNTHGGKKHPEERGRGGGGKPNLVLLLIYLILTAQRFKRNMEWNFSSQFFCNHLFIPPPSSLLSHLVFARQCINSKKTQLMDLGV